MSAPGPHLTAPGRLAALVVAAVATISLVAQFTLTYATEGTGSVTATLWWLAAYFTILTNVLVALIFGLAALKGTVSARRVAAVTLAIVLVALVYHSVLAGLRKLEGFSLWVDHGLHSAVPVLSLLWWLAFAPKTLTRRDLPSCLIWPATYAVYAVARGALTGLWAYPFLDADTLGWVLVARNILALIAAFVVFGLGMIAVAQGMQRRSVG